MLTLMLIVAVASFVNAETHFGGACYFTPDQDITGHKYAVELSTTCNDGTVAWDFPRGTLDIRLSKPGESFSLCLVDSSLLFIGGLHDLTGGKNLEIRLPTRDNDACTDAVNGEVELLVTAATDQYYWTSIDYKIVQK